MVQIRRMPLMRHLRSEPSSYVMHYRGGQLKKHGSGLAFWFAPLAASIAEVPCDDRELSFLFHGKSSDFQDVTAQGVIVYRVVDPLVLGERLDFSVHLEKGTWLKKPLEQLAQMLTQLAQQQALEFMAKHSVRDLLAEGIDELRERTSAGLAADSTLADMGLEIVAVRVADLSPTSELAKALQAPTRESIQQEADEATFERRALAVEKERAIQENELQNQIELAKREETLIGQRGANDRRRAGEEAEALSIEAHGMADRKRLEAGARADGIRAVEEARVGAERERMDVYRELPSHVLLGMAAQELAGKLQRIEHLNLTPDLFGGLLTNLVSAGTKKLNGEKKS